MTVTTMRATDGGLLCGYCRRTITVAPGVFTTEPPAVVDVYAAWDPRHRGVYVAIVHEDDTVLRHYCDGMPAGALELLELAR